MSTAPTPIQVQLGKDGPFAMGFAYYCRPGLKPDHHSVYAPVNALGFGAIDSLQDMELFHPMKKATSLCSGCVASTSVPAGRSEQLHLSLAIELGATFIDTSNVSNTASRSTCIISMLNASVSIPGLWPAVRGRLANVAANSDPHRSPGHE